MPPLPPRDTGLDTWLRKDLNEQGVEASGGEALLANENGLYAALWHAQAQYYEEDAAAQKAEAT